jgi:hypothetical protein
MKRLATDVEAISAVVILMPFSWTVVSRTASAFQAGRGHCRFMIAAWSVSGRPPDLAEQAMLDLCSILPGG